MPKPNFFILGAPKCGTTSMAKWLSDHPEIFISKSKEPHYYNTDTRRVVVNYNHYLSLFEEATKFHKIIGEASTGYIYSEQAVPNIINDLGNEHLKFLVMIRNPVQMAYSLHQQEVYMLNESVKSFKEAWHLQTERIKGKKISLLNFNKTNLLYGDLCKLGEQLERLYKKVDRNSVKVILLEDVKENAEKEYKNVLNFLNLSYDGRKNFNLLNEGKLRKSDTVAGLTKILGLIKRNLRTNKGFGILNKINTINAAPKVRDKLDVAFENELKEYFKDDILLLSSLINRDLSHWL